MSPIQLPEMSRAGLVDLYRAMQQAKREYDIALNATVAAHGLDPRMNHAFNLDTGEITPAVQEEAP